MCLIQKILDLFGLGKNKKGNSKKSKIVESITIGEDMMIKPVEEVKKPKPKKKTTSKKSESKVDTTEKKPRTRKPKKSSE